VNNGKVVTFTEHSSENLKREYVIIKTDLKLPSGKVFSVLN
jgi:hypothetical protein